MKSNRRPTNIKLKLKSYEIFFVKSVGQLLGIKGHTIGLLLLDFLQFPTRLISGVESYFPGMVHGREKVRQVL